MGGLALTLVVVGGVVLGSAQVASADGACTECYGITCGQGDPGDDWAYVPGCYYEGNCCPLWRQNAYENNYYYGCRIIFYRCTEWPNCSG